MISTARALAEAEIGALKARLAALAGDDRENHDDS